MLPFATVLRCSFDTGLVSSLLAASYSHLWVSFSVGLPWRHLAFHWFILPGEPNTNQSGCIHNEFEIAKEQLWCGILFCLFIYSLPSNVSSDLFVKLNNSLTKPLIRGITEYQLWIRLILHLRLWPLTTASFYFICKTNSERSAKRRNRSVPRSGVPVSRARVCVPTSFLWCASASSDVLIEGCCCLTGWGEGRRVGKAPKKEVTSIFMALDMHMLSTFNMWRQGKVF